ncbi:MAG TPA: hypothetical protein VJ744_00425 [Gaiellaceae bacterium]|nr:hypothetical protein [Gaiellaceae bacterium]
MKGIGAFVLVLLVALGVVMYVVTRPPDRVLDAQGEAWVDEFQGWRSAKERTVDRAIVGLTFTSQKKNARGLEPLRTCTASLRRIGTPPELLAPVEDAALDACGQAEHAVALNDRFDTASLASIRLHLNEAGDRLQLAARNLRVALGDAV